MPAPRRTQPPSGDPRFNPRRPTARPVTPRPHRRRAAATVGCGIALATALSLTGTGLAQATPATTPPSNTSPAASTPDRNSLLVGAVALDSSLAKAVRALKAAGADKLILSAAETVKNSIGQISPEAIGGLLGDLAPQQFSTATKTHQVSSTDPLGLLAAAGIHTFTPSIAPLCTTPSAENPLGVVTAGAGAVTGPWPLKAEPAATIDQILALLPGTAKKTPFNLVDAGETGYAFVPASPTTGGKAQVAWFNIDTLQGGFADLQPIGGVGNAPWTKLLPTLRAVRLAPVKTGHGTILSAVYGTADHGGHTCVFLPAVGVVNAR